MPTLLLSDDSLTVQRLIAMTFAEHDIDVVSVRDGEEAIARMVTQRPDIVLASIGTRKRSGYDVAAHVKSTPRLASIPVLLLAAAFDPVDEVRAAQVRCDGVLIKPLEPQQLVSRVRQLLQSDPGAPSAAIPPADESASTPEPGTGEDYFARLDAAFARRAASRPTVRPDDVGVIPTVDSVLTPAEPAARDIPTAGVAAPAVTDALVDEVARRVVERLGTAAVREVVADVVADLSERLIREEIDRIRRKA